MDNDAGDIDPAIAAAMGFSGFGTQQSKKRKFDRNDGVVDEASGQPNAGTGANSIVTGQRKPKHFTSNHTGGEKPIAQSVGADSATGTTTASSSTDATSWTPSALRQGMDNERGDVIYFRPSFLEDPWSGLEPK